MKVFTAGYTFASLRLRDYRLLWLAQLSTSMGQWMDQMTRGCPPAFYDRLSRGLCPRAPLMTLPSPSLRRLFSTSQRRAAPCSAGLRAAPAGCRGTLGARHAASGGCWGVLLRGRRQKAV